MDEEEEATVTVRLWRSLRDMGNGIVRMTGHGGANLSQLRVFYLLLLTQRLRKHTMLQFYVEQCLKSDEKDINVLCMREELLNKELG